MSRLVLVLGDQLSPDLSALCAADKSTDVVVMAEVHGEARTPAHHPQKIALIFAAMRKFATKLEAEGWRVLYAKLGDPANAHSITGELLRRAEETGATSVLATTPGDHRLMRMLDELPLPVSRRPDTRFISTQKEFEEWADGRKELRMEFFYRLMRRKTGILMDGDKPVGGKWNFDHDNRKPAVPDLFRPKPPRFKPDRITREVLDMVGAAFPDHFGTLDGFSWPTTAAEAEAAADHFFTHRLASFGDYQDAMLADDPFLYHSLLSPALNIGLLDPLALCQRAEAEYRAGRAPINAVEGFIRQILGWREYVRRLYMMEGPGYVTRNALAHTRALPALYWGAKTHMSCLSETVRQTRDTAYSHHIQRLMITGNFALLAGVDPAHVHDWYLAVYADAFEWVEAPNTIGMSQFADGGIIASKPYVSSANYIAKMSDYCDGCHYSAQAKTGAKACPFNLLYWHFIDRHEARFKSNRRMGNVLATWRRMEPVRKETILAEADAFLAKLDAGEVV